MADGGLTVLDGTVFRSPDLCLPELNGAVTVTGARLLEIAESTASSSLFGLSLPETLKSGALKRLKIDAVSFPSTEVKSEEASSILQDYLFAIAEELNDDPLVVSILDGSALRLFMEDEDDFAMLAENLFTDLDTKDTGKLSKNEIRNALVQMGVEMGVPPFSESATLVNNIIKKNGAEGEEELGQAQFAQLLQPVLQDLADALAEKHVVVIQNIKVINGSKLRKVLASEEILNDVIERMFQEQNADENGNASREKVRRFLEQNGLELGLPPSEANEAVVLLYDQVFANINKEKSDKGLEKDEFRVVVKEILETFAQQLEANPIFLDFET